MAEQSIAHYNLLEPIGRGGLGAVFRARDTRVGRTVALKILEPALVADETRRLALVDEANLAARLPHPNIATLFEVSATPDSGFLAYEFIAGSALRSEMTGHPVAPRRAIDLCIQIADALADGHAAGLLHGDLRPETVIVTAKGSAKLLDYGLSRWTRGGLARRAAGRAPESLPDEDAAIAAYMAPEAALGGEVDGRADIFSLGTVLYEMLTGIQPFAAATVQDTVMKVVSVTPPAPSTIRGHIAAEFDAITSRALSKDLNGRYQSAAALSAELRRLVTTLEPRPDVRKEEFLLPVDDTADKVPAAVWLAGVGLVAALGLLIWWL